MNHDKINKLIKLAKLGSPGEADNAAKLLARILGKHGYTIEKYNDEYNTSDDETKRYEFRWKSKYQKQLLCSVALSLGIKQYIRTKGSRNYYEFDLTRAKAVEFEYLYELYTEELNKELDAFTRAFCAQNRLYLKASDDDDDEQPKQQFFLTPEQVEMRDRARIHMRNIDPLQVRKGIEE